MAIYHLSQGFISRSTGRSAVQSAAYITGSKMYESRRGLRANYQNRARDVLYTDTLAPDYAPEWAKDANQIWDRLENYEDKYAEKRYKTFETQEKYKSCAQVAQTIVVALPRELSFEVNHEAIREFALKRFVSRGLVVSYAIHDDEGNPHAHLQISRRRLDENRQFSWAKDREICKKSELMITRKLWADLANHYLEREGFEERLTEKSFLALGLDLLPSKHRGWLADKLAGRPIQPRLIYENKEITLENRRALLENPETVLVELTVKQATFTQQDLFKAIQKRIGDDEALIAQVFEGGLQKAIVVGEDREGRTRYTSEAYRQLEEKAIALTKTLTTQVYQQRVTEKAIEKALETSPVRLNEEQQQSGEGACGESTVSSLGWTSRGW